MLSVSTQIACGEDLLSFAAMLKSVAFADQIIIFNMDRTDKPAKDLFKQYGAKVINVKTPKVVEVIRSDQVKAGKDWVLIMDYDEIIPSALAKEIESVIKKSSFSTYLIRRRNFSLGMALSHGGWGDDAVPRLFKVSDFVSWPKEIHSLPLSKGKSTTLANYMEHHKDASLSQMVEKTNRYSDIEARQFFEGGLPVVTPFTLIRKTVMEFIRRYFLKLGFLDGRIGLFQSFYQGYSVFITYSKLYELQRKNQWRKPWLSVPILIT